MRLLHVAVAAVVIGLVAGGAYAVGASSGGDSVRACAKKHGGALRIAKKCRKGERRVVWSKVGPAGPPGQDGTDGVPGAPGSARAYAWVTAAHAGQPSFKAGTATGFTAVSSPQQGYYCLTLPASIDATKAAPQASIVWESGFANVPEYAYVYDPALADPAFDCDGRNDIEVLTFSGSSTSPTPSLDFTVLVP